MPAMIRASLRALTLAFALVGTGCTADKVVALAEIDGSGTRGVAHVHEAITKAFTIRVDVFVEVDDPQPGMLAALAKGSCADPGMVVQVLAVHPRGEGGAAEVVLPEGRLSDLDGHSIHVFAGGPEASARLACGEI